MWGVAGGAFSPGYWKMDKFSTFQHVFVFLVAGKAEGAVGGPQKMFINGAMGIVALEALLFLEWPVLEFFMAHIGMTFLVQAGKLFCNIFVVSRVLRLCLMATAAFAF
jgi:hypothetical protein